MPVIDPKTGKPYGANVNPFESTQTITDPKLAEQMQKDYQTIFGNKPPARMRPQLSILDGKPITNDTGGGVLQAGETVEQRNARLGFGGTPTPEVSPLPPVTSPTTSTNDLRNGENMVKGQAAEGLKSLDAFHDTTNQLLQDITGFKTYSQTDAGKQAQEDLDKIRKSLGQFNESELAQIQQAGQAQGAKYDPLIGDAQESKRKGLPQAVIAGGERGGFMSTQFAGSAALAKTNGGDFIGAGGELENIQSVYDRNIDNLRSAKLSAIAQAEAAARSAITTGKQTDYKLFADAYDRAQKASQDELALAQEKVNAVSTYEKQAQARTVYEQGQQDRTAEGILGSIVPQLTGDATANQALIDKIAKENDIDPARLTTYVSEYKRDLDQKTFESIKANKSFTDTIPEGETFTDPASGIKFMGTKDPEQLNVVQTIGNNEYQVRYDLSDPNNPKELFKIDLGPKWKAGGGSSPGKKTNTTLDDALAQAALYLDGKKQTGDFNDLNYEATVQSIYNEYEQIPEISQGGQSGPELISDILNKKLEAIDKSRGVSPSSASGQSTSQTNDSRGRAPAGMSWAQVDAQKQGKEFIGKTVLDLKTGLNSDTFKRT